jgi:hypothetical protein
MLLPEILSPGDYCNEPVRSTLIHHHGIISPSCRDFGSSSGAAFPPEAGKRSLPSFDGEAKRHPYFAEGSRFGRKGLCSKKWLKNCVDVVKYWSYCFTPY